MARGKQIIKINEIKNLSSHTITTYRTECNYFIQWFGADNSIRKVNEETIEDYILFAKKGNISQTYVATKMRQGRAFLYFCMDREYMDSFKIRIPKADEVIKEPYTAKELERLIKKPELGRSTLTMTNHYLNLYSTDLQKNYDKFNPLDNLTKERV